MSNIRSTIQSHCILQDGWSTVHNELLVILNRLTNKELIRIAKGTHITVQLLNLFVSQSISSQSIFSSHGKKLIRVVSHRLQSIKQENNMTRCSPINLMIPFSPCLVQGGSCTSWTRRQGIFSVLRMRPGVLSGTLNYKQGISNPSPKSWWSEAQLPQLDAMMKRYTIYLSK